jgi:hypothetical protein
MDSKIVKTEIFDINSMENLSSHDGISFDVKKLLKAYKKKREDGNKVQVIYEYGKDLKKLKLGRLYPQKGLGLQNFPSDIRVSLAHKYYHDIDMVNSQPTILTQLCEKNGWECKYLSEYVQNRESYLEDICKYNSCDRDTAKTLCISIMFGAKPKNVPIKIKELVNELDKISQNITKLYPDIFIQCKKKENPTASCLANVLQDIEFKILREIDLKLQKKEWSMDVYIHDGGLVRRKEEFCSFPEEVLSEIMEEIKESTGYNITLSEKKMVNTIEFKRDIIRMPFVFEREYQQRKDEFEATHFYCNETSTICQETSTGLIHTNKADARITFASYSFQKTIDKNIKTISFIKEWLEDPSKRTINKLVFNPNLLEEIKDDEYNLFKGFKASTYDGSINEEKEILDRFQILLEQNAGKKPELINYFIKWFAYMIQSPHLAPGVAIILINTSHGTGKDTLGDFIRQKVIGDEYSKNIINVETELFDSHSIAFDKTIFMKLEECNGASTRKHSDMFKSMITAKTSTINPKGMKKYVTDAYPHIMITTNNTTPVKVEQNDRRFCISYTSDDYVGNRDFWKETYRLFDLPEAGFVVYKYLMEQDLTEFIAQDFPKTSYHQSLSLAETPSELLYLKNSGEFKDIKSLELYEKYYKYCEDNHLPPKSQIGFSRALSPLIEQQIIIKRMKDGYALYTKILREQDTTQESTSGISQGDQRENTITRVYPSFPKEKLPEVDSGAISDIAYRSSDIAYRSSDIAYRSSDKPRIINSHKK